MLKKHSVSCLFLIFLRLSSIETARILGSIIYPGHSHEIFFQPLWEELSLRGHDVTVITSRPSNNRSLVNLTEIDISFTKKILEEKKLDIVLRPHGFLFWKMLWAHDLNKILLNAQVELEGVQKLIKNESEHFDLVIVEGFWPSMYAFGERFNAPVISISSLSPFLHCHDMMGNPTHPVYPDMLMTDIDNYSFAYRLRGFLYNIWYRALFYWYLLPKEDKIARKFFGDDIPYIGDIFENTSLLLVNVNPIMSIPRANVPNVIEISQLHIRDKMPLPRDLQDFLDSSKQGAVYFSLGTNVNNINLNPEFLETVVQAFSELPYNIIWKNEMGSNTSISDNVLIRDWLPQQDILGHPNIKVFVTQGGLQSIEEAIWNEVPMVGIPFIVDQPLNVKVLSEKGLAKKLDFDTMTKDDLKEAIIEVAEDKRYKQKISEAAAIIKDQPMRGLDKAIYWIEYVLRHKGAKHLRSPAAKMPLYKYFMVDVVVFLIVSCYFCIFIMGRLYRLIDRKRRNNKLKEN